MKLLLGRISVDDDQGGGEEDAEKDFKFRELFPRQASRRIWRLINLILSLFLCLHTEGAPHDPFNRAKRFNEHIETSKPSKE